MQDEQILLRKVIRLPRGMRLFIKSRTSEKPFYAYFLKLRHHDNCMILILEENRKRLFLLLKDIEEIKISDYILFENEEENFFVDEERLPKGIFALDEPSADGEVLKHNINMLFSQEYKDMEASESFCLTRPWTHAVNAYVEKSGRIVRFTNYPMDEKIYIPIVFYLGIVERSPVAKIKRIFVKLFWRYTPLRYSDKLGLSAKFSISQAAYYKNIYLGEKEIIRATQMNEIYKRVKDVFRRKYGI